MSEPEKIVIAGKEFSGEEFRQKLIENNWSAESDGRVFDALFESFWRAQEANRTARTYETKSELKRGDELYTMLLDTVMPGERQGKQKRDILRELIKWDNIDGDERKVIDEYLNSLAYTVMRERHEADREGFVESMNWGGWDRPGDKAFLEKLYDQRLDKDGNIIKEFDGFLSSLDKETSGLAENRKAALSELEKLLEKIPGGERTAEQEELLSFAKAGISDAE